MIISSIKPPFILRPKNEGKKQIIGLKQEKVNNCTKINTDELVIYTKGFS
jgi:hypothetical protein